MEATEVEVSAARSVGPGTVALDVVAPPGFDALPGQFVLVRATVDGQELARHYTLSSPSVGETFEITVGVDPDGTLSPWLAAREAGDTVRLEGPFGTVAYGGDGDVVVLAGGPGVGAAVGVAEAAVAAGHEAAVVYEDDAPAHEDRLSGLAAAGADVAVVHREGFRPAVDRVADRAARRPEGTFVFGFRPFCDRCLDALAAAGVPTDDVQVENYG